MKPIPDFPGYFVTDDGRIWSAPREGHVFGRWLRPRHDIDGYLMVGLWRDGKQYQRRTHRLVLETFVGPCPSGMECCHDNGNPSDNRVKNLRWDTPSANCYDAARHGTAPGLKNRGEKNGSAKLTETQVRQIIVEYETGRFFQWEIASKYGVSRATVGLIVNGKHWRHLRPPRVEAV